MLYWNGAALKRHIGLGGLCIYVNLLLFVNVSCHLSLESNDKTTSVTLPYTKSAVLLASVMGAMETCRENCRRLQGRKSRFPFSKVGNQIYLRSRLLAVA